MKSSISTRSAKAKGRKLQQHARDLVLAIHPELEPDDVQSCAMGASGADLKLSPAARKLFPYSVECKSWARHAVYAFLDQAAQKPGEPLVIVKANKRKPLAVVDLDHFMTLLDEVKRLRR